MRIFLNKGKKKPKNPKPNTWQEWNFLLESDLFWLNFNWEDFFFCSQMDSLDKILAIKGLEKSLMKICPPKQEPLCLNKPLRSGSPNYTRQPLIQCIALLYFLEILSLFLNKTLVFCNINPLFLVLSTLDTTEKWLSLELSPRQSCCLSLQSSL